ncbi:MAG: response regulator [Spirochaetota bacterium]
MNILIVDDNDRYAENLETYFQQRGVPTKRAYDAREGWSLFAEQKFHTIISDITMESQTSGLWLVRRIYKSGYSGNIVIATTGFDFPGVMFLGYYTLPRFAGIGWMVPKKPLKQGIVELHPTYLKKNTSYESTLLVEKAPQ